MEPVPITIAITELNAFNEMAEPRANVQFVPTNLIRFVVPMVYRTVTFVNCNTKNVLIKGPFKYSTKDFVVSTEIQVGVIMFPL